MRKFFITILFLLNGLCVAGEDDNATATSSDQHLAYKLILTTTGSIVAATLCYCYGPEECARSIVKYIAPASALYHITQGNKDAVTPLCTMGLLTVCSLLEPLIPEVSYKAALITSVAMGTALWALNTALGYKHTQRLNLSHSLRKMAPRTPLFQPISLCLYITRCLPPCLLLPSLLSPQAPQATRAFRAYAASALMLGCAAENTPRVQAFSAIQPFAFSFAHIFNTVGEALGVPSRFLRPLVSIYGAIPFVWELSHIGISIAHR